MPSFAQDDISPEYVDNELNKLEMNHRKTLGKKGEDIAIATLQHEGHHIVATNWRSGHKEIDIIAFKDNTFIFIEVKTRSHIRFGLPEMAVTETKAEHVTSAALEFLEGKCYKHIRFDVISIVIKHEQVLDYLHIKDAFY